MRQPDELGVTDVTSRERYDAQDAAVDTDSSSVVKVEVGAVSKARRRVEIKTVELEA